MLSPAGHPTGVSTRNGVIGNDQGRVRRYDKNENNVDSGFSFPRKNHEEERRVEKKHVEEY